METHTRKNFANVRKQFSSTFLTRVISGAEELLMSGLKFISTPLIADPLNHVGFSIACWTYLELRSNIDLINQIIHTLELYSNLSISNRVKSIFSHLNWILTVIIYNEIGVFFNNFCKLCCTIIRHGNVNRISVNRPRDWLLWIRGRVFIRNLFNGFFNAGNNEKGF